MSRVSSQYIASTSAQSCTSRTARNAFAPGHVFASARASSRHEVISSKSSSVKQKTYEAMFAPQLGSMAGVKVSMRKTQPYVNMSEKVKIVGDTVSTGDNISNNKRKDKMTEGYDTASLDHVLSNLDNSFYSSLLDETVYKGVREHGKVLSSQKIKQQSSSTKKVVRESNTSSQNQNQENDGENFYTRAGRAAKSLQEDFPMVFKQAPTMDIYSENVAFVDDLTVPGSPKTSEGLEAYQRQLWSLRLHSYLFCSSIKMQVLRIWQPQEDKTIHVRWSIKATPRLIGTIIEKPYYIDGLSEFRFNDEGLIDMHKVTRVDWDRSMFALRNIQRSLNVISNNNGGPMMPC